MFWFYLEEVGCTGRSVWIRTARLVGREETGAIHKLVREYIAGEEVSPLGWCMIPMWMCGTQVKRKWMQLNECTCDCWATYCCMSTMQ